MDSAKSVPLARATSLLLRVVFVVQLSFIVGASASAQPSMMRDSLIADIRSQIYTPGIPDSTIIRAMNRATLQVSADFPAILKFDTVTIGASDFGATLNSDFNRFTLVVRKGSIQQGGVAYDAWIPITPVSEDSLPYFRESIKSLLSTPDNPLYPEYCWSSGDRVFVFPLPSETYTLYIWYYANAPNIPTGSDSASAAFIVGGQSMDEKYRERIISLTISFLMAGRTLYEDAAWYLNRYYGNVTPVSKSAVGEK